MDRCATDAISYVTGVKLGRRSLKFIDNGIMAATFVNLETGKAFRIVSTETARDLAPILMPHIEDPRLAQLEAYKIMDDSDLFTVSQVKVNVPASDMPGPTRFKAVCARCGIVVRDKKEVFKTTRSCAGPVPWEPIMSLWIPMKMIPKNKMPFEEHPHADHCPNHRPTRLR